jgi:hypothetical protein
MSTRERPMATCPHDGAPLIATCAFRKAEFYCLECGARLGFLSPAPAQATPELNERYEALQAEWDQHAGAALLGDGAWHRDCPKCEVGVGEPHRAHASAEELAAHEAAIAWLEQRAAKRNGTAAS